MSDEVIDADAYSQQGGTVVISSMSGAGELSVRVAPADRLTLLLVVLTAIRVDGTAEELDIAAKHCRSNLSTLRGSR